MKTVDVLIDGMAFNIVYPPNRDRPVLEEIMESIFTRKDLVDFHKRHTDKNPFYFKTMVGDAKVTASKKRVIR